MQKETDLQYQTIKDKSIAEIKQLSNEILNERKILENDKKDWEIEKND